MMSERNVFVINQNFELIFGRLNKDILPTMNSFRKFVAKQKNFNKKTTLLMIGFGIYIYFNEARQYEREQELKKLKEEINELKGE